VYLSIFSLLKEGLSPAQICERLGMKKQAVQRHITSMKNAGMIKKIGYGVWEILKEDAPKQVHSSRHITPPCFPTSTLNRIRGHGFMFTIRIPHLKNWDNRASILKRQGITFKSINKLGSPQSIMFKGRKILLYSNSIIVYEPASYLSDSAQGSRNRAVADLLSLIASLETLLHTSFRIHGDYQFKVSRSHYAMMKNELAKQYDQDGRKLHIYNADGLWFLIDNSFNLHEAETVHPHTSDSDMDKHVRPFFNGLKEVEGFTPQFVLGAMAQQTKNLDDYVMHLKAHVESVQELGRQTKQLGESVKDLTAVVKKLETKGSKQSDDEIDKRGF